MKRVIKKLLFFKRQLSHSWSYPHFSVREGNDFHGLIFSKDRPLQLQALLQSFLENVDNCPGLTVLYRVSNPGFEQAYDDLKKEFKNVIFVLESDFRLQLHGILENLSAARIFFLVDDILFFKPFSLQRTLSYHPLKSIFSLRMGANLDYCYAQKRHMKKPQDFKSEGDVISWTWEKGRLDWAYPLSLDGHIFWREEFIYCLSQINFKAPNSLEAALQVFSPVFKMRKGYAFLNSVMFNNPCNKVQDEIMNHHGKVQVQDLLKFWQEGLRIDLQSLKNFSPTSVHSEVSFSFTKKIKSED